MWRDARSPRDLLRPAARLLRLELQLMTGGRTLLLLGAQVTWLLLMTLLWPRFLDEEWDPASYYNRTILLPCLVPAIALGMSCVLAERDDRHLEMSLASPGGRFLLWSFRLGALAVALAAASLLLACLTWLLAGQELPPLAAAAHAWLPAFAAATLAAFLALLLNGTSSAGLITGGLFVAAFVFHGGGMDRFDPYLNPFLPPDGLRDPQAWFRILTFNRLLLLTVAAASIAGMLALLQRRERLL